MQEDAAVKIKIAIRLLAVAGMGEGDKVLPLQRKALEHWYLNRGEKVLCWSHLYV